MPKSPESEILAKFFANMSEKCGEKMADFFADFGPSISRRSGRKKFHEKLATNSAGREIKFFHRETLGVWGHKKANKGSRAKELRAAMNIKKATPAVATHIRVRQAQIMSRTQLSHNRNEGTSSERTHAKQTPEQHRTTK